MKSFFLVLFTLLSFSFYAQSEGGCFITFSDSVGLDDYPDSVFVNTSEGVVKKPVSVLYNEPPPADTYSAPDYSVDFVEEINFSNGRKRDFSAVTLNCEFLSRRKIHVKYGEKLNLSSKLKSKWDGIREARFVEACEKTARFLVSTKADIFFLTEVGDGGDVFTLFSEMKYLDKDFDNYAVSVSRDTYTAQNVAIIYKNKFSRGGIINTLNDDREIYFPEEDDKNSEEQETGISKGGTFLFSFPGTSHSVETGEDIFIVILAHLKSEGGGADGDAQRIAQATILRREALKYQRDGIPVMIVGDLNDGQGQPAILRARGFDDIERNFETVALDKYFSDNSQRWTYEYKGRREIIDHFLLSSHFTNLLKSRSGINSSTIPAPVEVSDHRAFKVEFKFN